MGSGSHTLFPGFSVEQKRLWRCHSRLTELEVRLLGILIGPMKLSQSMEGLFFKGLFFNQSVISTLSSKLEECILFEEAQDL